MACNSLTALPRVCNDGVVAGIEKLYMIAFKDLKAVSSSTTEVYSATTAGVINQVGLVTGKTFVEVALLKSTAGLEEKLTKDNTKGTSFYTQTLKLVLGDLTIENSTFIGSVTNQPVAIIIKTRTGKYFITGLNGQFEVISVEGGTGSAESDLIGYTISFAGITKGLTPLLDSTLISTITA